MSFNVIPDAFSTAEDARRQAEERGFPFFEEHMVVPITEGAVKGKPHFHGFDTLTFVLEGFLDFTDLESGKSYKCGRGTLVEQLGGAKHFETHKGFRAYTAYRIDPKTLPMPYAHPA